MKTLSEEDVLKEIHENGDSAYSLLYDANKNFSRRFKRLDNSIKKLLEDVRKYFPDAQYYTASGGFNLMLGNPHNLESGEPQEELMALNGFARIEDGDF